MVSGAKIVRIHGQDVPVAAEIHNIGALSAHADANEILAWFGSTTAAPKTTFITHGEPSAAQALQARIADKLGWRSVVPELGQQTELD